MSARQSVQQMSISAAQMISGPPRPAIQQPAFFYSAPSRRAPNVV